MRFAMIVILICALSLIIGAQVICEESASSISAYTRTAKPSGPGAPYTSVIIDASGLNLQRSMSPKIRQMDGSEVWGTVKVDYDFIEDHGIVAFATSMDDAKKNSRCGSNPMIISAFKVVGPNSSDPAISKEDAELLLAENGKGKFLDKFNVIFVKGDKPVMTAQAK